jgi:hypothetical protein
MTVESGSINLPIDDLVEFLLARITPEELAEGIISDDDARAALVHKLAERYSEPGFTDTDRREFLTKVQQQVYAVAVDRAIERLNREESNERSRSDYYRWKAVELGHYTGIYEYTLRQLEGDEGRTKAFTERHTHPDQLAAYFKENRDPVVGESVGKQWYESRDYWRARLEECFPEPASLPEEPR